MSDYQPTHVSKDDGAPAMMRSTNGPLCIMVNENGDQWPDEIDDWTPIRREQPEDIGQYEHRISTYECERWRQMSDELVGQADRLRHLCDGGTRAEWQAIEAINSAARQLFGAFAGLMMERRDASNT